METEARWRGSPASAIGAVAPVEVNPWRTIWFSPRQTIRALLTTENPPNWLPACLAFLLGNFLAQINDAWAQGHLTFHVVVVGGVLGFSLSFAVLWAAAWFLGVYGRWRGGAGSAKNLRMALGWSCAPSVIEVLAWGPIWILSGGVYSEESTVETVAQFGAATLDMFVALADFWVAMLAVATVAEVHRFSVWRSIESLACTFFAMVVAMFFALAPLRFITRLL